MRKIVAAPTLLGNHCSVWMTQEHLGSMRTILTHGNGLPLQISQRTKGYVRAYQWSVDTSTWEQLGSELFAGCTRVGSSVAMSSDGSYVALGNSGFVSQQIKSCN